MKTLRLLVASAFLVAAFSSCHPDPVYVPVYVPTETPTKAKPKTVYKKPTPKPQSAEDFRAVEKPSSYSN